MLLEGRTSWNIDTWDIGHYRHRNDPHGCRYTCPSKSGCMCTREAGLTGWWARGRKPSWLVSRGCPRRSAPIASARCTPPEKTRLVTPLANGRHIERSARGKQRQSTKTTKIRVSWVAMTYEQTVEQMRSTAEM